MGNISPFIQNTIGREITNYLPSHEDLPASELDGIEFNLLDELFVSTNLCVFKLLDSNPIPWQKD